jgi:hypothetical protein
MELGFVAIYFGLLLALLGFDIILIFSHLIFNKTFGLAAMGLVPISFT